MNNNKFDKNLDSRDRSQVSDMTTSEAIEASRLIANVFSDVVTAYEKKVKQTRDISRKQLIKALKPETIFANVYGVLKLKLKREYENKTWDKKTSNDFARLMMNFLTKDSEGNTKLGPLALQALDLLKDIEGIGVKVDNDANVLISDTTLEEEIEDLEERLDQLEGWQTSAENHSKKESMSNTVKRYLSKIPIKGKTDKFGFKTYMDFNQAYATLIDAVTEQFTEDEMIEAVKKLAKTRPEFTSIYEKLLEDNDFRWDFFSGLQSTKVDYKFVKETVRGSGLKRRTTMSVGSSNRTQLSKMVLEDWRGTFRMLKSSRSTTESIINNDGSINTVFAKELMDKVDRIEPYLSVLNVGSDPTGPIWVLFDALEEIGLVVSDDERNAMVSIMDTNGQKSKDISNSAIEASGIFNQLSKGVDIFDESGEKSLYVAVNNVAKAVASSKIHSYESCFRNSEGKSVYANQIPFELTQWFARFKKRGLKGNKAFYSGSTFFGQSPWLRKLFTSNRLMKNFVYTQFDGFSEEKDRMGTRYSKLSDRQLEMANISMYLNNANKNYAFYKCPVFSNSPRGVYIQFEKYEFIDDIIADLTRVGMQEYTRIRDIRDRRKQREELVANLEPIPKELEPIKNYDRAESEQFLLITCLNENLEQNIEKFERKENLDEVRATIKEWVKAETAKEYKRLKEIGVFTTKENSKGEEITKFADSRFGKYGLKSDFLLYHASSMLAYSQLSTLFTGDVAFYSPNMVKDSKTGKMIPDVHRSVDLSKRIKEAVSPKHILNNNATYALSQKDMEEAGLNPETDSNIISCGETYNVAIIQDDEVYDGVYGKAKYDAMIADGVNPIRAAQIAASYGYSNTEIDGTRYAEADGTKFKTQKINISDGQTFISLDRYRKIMIGAHRWNKELQEMYNRLIKNKGTKGDINTFMTQLKPFMFGMQKIGNTIIPSQHKNSEFVVFPQLAENSEFFKKCLDVFENESVDAVSYASVVKVGLNNVGKDLSSDIVVQEFSNENFGMQQETPEHLQDAGALLGTQIRKLICANLSPNAVFDVKGMKLSKDQLLTLYQGLLFSNVKQSYEELLKGQQHLSAEDISNLLTQELKDRGYGQDFIEAVKIVKKTDPLTGEDIKTFEVPLYTPTIAKELEQVLHALFKNRVSKQKIKGGVVVQVSGVGYSDELRMHFKEVKDTKDGSIRKSIDYMDCMMPWYSKKNLELVMDENGQIDIEKIRKIDPELLEVIGYRIPTEGLYSIAKLRIKEFLPRESGSSIILPMEITKLSNSNFKMAKMYLILKEFSSNNIYEIIRCDYDELKEQIINGGIINYLLKLNKKQRNNLIIDVFNAILSHSTSLEKILDSSPFQSLEDLKDELINNTNIQEELPIILPSSQSKVFRVNMDRIKLIKYVTNSNTAHSVLQHFNIKFKYPVKFNGKESLRIDRISHFDSNILISKTLSDLFSAFVDKDNVYVLYDLNINEFTYGVFSCIIRMGYSLRTAILFINQPSIRLLTNKIKQLNSKVYNIQRVYEQLIYEITSKIYSSKSYSNVEVTNLDDEDMLLNIRSNDFKSALSLKALNSFMIYYKNHRRLMQEVSKLSKIDTFNTNLSVVHWRKVNRRYKDIIENSSICGHREILLGRTAAAFYSGNINNNPIAQKLLTQGYLHLYNSVVNEFIKKEIKSLYFDNTINATVILLEENQYIYVSFDIKEVLDYAYTNITKEFKYSSLLAYYEYGLRRPLNEISRLFPWGKKFFIDSLKKETLEKRKNLLPNEEEKFNYKSYQQICRKTHFMNKASRIYSINEFPKEFVLFKQNNPELFDSNLLLKKLILVNKGKSNLVSIIFYNNGSITKSEIQDLKNYWIYLLEDINTKDFAISLIQYTFNVYGFYMSPRSFSHLVPIYFFTEIDVGRMFIKEIEEIMNVYI